MVKIFLIFLISIQILLAKEKPNVLLIYTDDQGALDAACYGAKDLVTPAMDKLARTGVRFNQMLAPSAICSASRAGLLTGQYPYRAGMPGNAGSHYGSYGLSPSLYLMPEMFRDNGYATEHVGKWHLGYTPETMPLAQGFDHSFGHMGGCIDNYSHFFYWNGPNKHDLWRDGVEVFEDGKNFGPLMVDEIKNITSRESEEPFFIYWAINWPHYPLQGFDKWRQHYAMAGLESPRDKYAAFVSSMDELIGQVVEHLEKIGKRENTIILVQSDHGHSVEERTFHGGGYAGPYRGHKSSFFEGGLRVPSIISWPAKLPQGEVREQWVTGCDWYPTFAKWIGAKLPETVKFDGKPIDRVIASSESKSPHTKFLWSFQESKKAHWAMREGSWKLISNPRDYINKKSLNSKKDAMFLVNLDRDIGEKTNLAAQHPEKVEKLLQLREKEMVSIRRDVKNLQELMKDNLLSAKEKKEGWVLMFDGKSLGDWQVDKWNPEGFSIEKDSIKCHGKPSMLYYKKGKEMVDFHFVADVMTKPGANSGIFFHTKYQDKGWPVGHEAQVNCTQKDPVKTGSLYIVDKYLKQAHQDNEWFKYEIIVKGNNIVTKVNDKVICNYTEVKHDNRRMLSKGTIGLQAHDPGSVVYYKNIKFKSL
jgi:arylsulfatase A-like enzyme